MKTLQLANAEFLPHVCELVREGNSVSIRAKGNSMRPYIESERDVAVLTWETRFKVHDVVLAEIAPGHYVLHRIDRITDADGRKLKGSVDDPQAHVTLRGDGNVKGTEQCLLGEIRALVSHFVRKGKTVSTQSRFYRCYGRVWRFLLPVRRYLLALYRLLWRHEQPQRWTKHKNQ